MSNKILVGCYLIANISKRGEGMDMKQEKSQEVQKMALPASLYASKYTLVFDVNQPGRKNEQILYNPVAGSAHIVDMSVVKMLDDIKNKRSVGEVDDALVEFFMDKGYLYSDPAEEEKKERLEFEKYRLRAQEGAFQVILTTTYKCNLNCSYCYQDVAGLTRTPHTMTPEMFEKADEFTNRLLKQKHEQFYYYLLYGGEPLLPGVTDRTTIERVVKECKMFDIPLAAVTNGVYLLEYCDLFKDVRIGELQITVDGPAEVHDRRKRTVDGRGSFERIMQGIDKAVEYGFPINFKTVIDRENIAQVTELAEIVDSKGWLDLPDDKFKIQLAENAGLCSPKREAGNDNYMRPIEILESLYKEAQRNSSMKKFFRPFCMGIRVLHVSGMPPHPRFGACSAGTLQLCFGPDGYVYPCMVHLGFPEHSIGTYFPEVEIKENGLQEYQVQPAHHVKECNECALKYVCGGRCVPSVQAMNTPPCPDVKKIMQFGFDYYLPMIEEKWLQEEGKTGRE
jgi:uncharacterized protein